MESFCLFFSTDRLCWGKPLMARAAYVVKSCCPLCSNSGCPCWFAIETKECKASPFPVECPLTVVEDICVRSLSFCVATKPVPEQKKSDH